MSAEWMEHWFQLGSATGANIYCGHRGDSGSLPYTPCGSRNWVKSRPHDEQSTPRTTLHGKDCTGCVLNPLVGILKNSQSKSRGEILKCAQKSFSKKLPANIGFLEKMLPKEQIALQRWLAPQYLFSGLTFSINWANEIQRMIQIRCLSEIAFIKFLGNPPDGIRQ